MYTIKLIVVELTKLCCFFSVALNYANQLPFCILITKHSLETDEGRKIPSKHFGQNAGKRPPHCFLPLLLFSVLFSSRHTWMCVIGEKKTHPAHHGFSQACTCITEKKKTRRRREGGAGFWKTIQRGIKGKLIVQARPQTSAE